jgi:hypothetical protein
MIFADDRRRESIRNLKSYSEFMKSVAQDDFINFSPRGRFNSCGKKLRGQRDGSLRPYSRFSRQEPLLFYQVAPQFVLTRLSGPRSNLTAPGSPRAPGTATYKSNRSNGTFWNRLHQTAQHVATRPLAERNLTHSAEALPPDAVQFNVTQRKVLTPLCSDRRRW